MTVGNWLTVVGLAFTFLMSFAAAAIAFAVLRSRTENNTDLTEQIGERIGLFEKATDERFNSLLTGIERGMTPREKEIDDLHTKVQLIHIKLFGAYGNNGLMSEVEEIQRAIRRLENRSITE